MSSPQAMTPLDLITFPLKGLSLIEASAGTGKTYALANIYVRYLLESQYSVEEILVVTFTDAATQELRDRIRARIVELGALFDQVIDCCIAEDLSFENVRGLEPAIKNLSPDTLMQHMILRSENVLEDRMRLTIAERQIDLAEIHTIHGFCQKAIQESSVALGLAPDQRLQEDMKLMHLDVCEDLWRRLILKLPAAPLSFVAQNWPSPAALLHAVSPMLQREPEVILPALPITDPTNEDVDARLDDWSLQFDAAHEWEAQLKQQIIDQGAAALEDLESSGIKRLKNKLDWFSQVQAWAESESALFEWPGDKKKNIYFWRFTHEALQNEMSAKGKMPSNAFFTWLTGHLERAPAPVEHGFMLAFFETLKREVALRKSRDSLLSFDDLIFKIESALLEGERRTSDEVEAFSSTMRQQYSVALIDEFQDTDRAQYHIFSRIFGPKAGEDASNLVLIGDPKQAIYGFRGGDMATYLRAKQEVQSHPKGACFTMTQNWRSSPEMVNAVNQIFLLHSNPFMEAEIPFVEVQAAKSSPNSAWPSALNIVQVPAYDSADSKALTKDEIEDSLALACVSGVTNLLAQGEQLELKSSDIAILVRTRNEAAHIKNCLAQAGVKASYDVRESVFDSPEALAVLFLLEAVHEPRNEKKIKRCIVEILFGYTDEQFELLYTDQASLGALLSTFEKLNQIWEKQGVLSMVRHALTDLDVFSNWRRAMSTEAAGSDSKSATQALIEGSWERTLTNLNQIGELLQLQSRKLRGHHVLIRWLHRQLVDERTEADDAYTMRLESDEDLIQIVTVHQSKGLEYPVVFLPFLHSAKKGKQAWFYDDNKKLCLSLDPSDEQKARAERERQAEDIRLMYVALTRSKYACFIGTSAYKGHGVSLGCRSSAWGKLVVGPLGAQNLEDEGLADALSILNERADCQFRQLSTEQILEEYEQNFHALTAQRKLSEQGKSAAELHARLLTRSVYHDWRVNSFTALMHEDRDRNQAHGSSQSVARSDTMADTRTDTRTDKEMAVGANLGGNIGAAQAIPIVPDIHILNFPRGSEAGTFLHTLFEGVDFSSGALNAKLAQRFDKRSSYIEELLRKKMLVPESTIVEWAGYLDLWLTETLALPIKPDCALDQLHSSDYLVEMSFHFQVGPQQASEFNQIVRAYNPNASALYFSGFEGHIKGAIDLVFRQGGRYYILDYKSNHLGFDAQSYAQSALESAMAEHRYDVQYLLYSIALHRFLEHRLGDAYDYDKDFGGVFYLFLRGMALPAAVLVERAEESGAENHLSGVYFTRPEKSQIEALDAMLREGVKA
jgi:exodeoxyribonuclease V beta subunit